MINNRVKLIQPPLWHGKGTRNNHTMLIHNNYYILFLLILYTITFILKVNKVCSFLNIFHEVRSFLLYIFYFIYIIWIILIKIISVIVIFKFIIIFLNVVIYSYSHIYCIFLSYFLSPVVIAA